LLKILHNKLSNSSSEGLLILGNHSAAETFYKGSFHF